MSIVLHHLIKDLQARVAVLEAKERRREEIGGLVDELAPTQQRRKPGRPRKDQGQVA